jgi:hypothetical protein
VPSSEDSWERWEFGNESFIDRALAEPDTSSELLDDDDDDDLDGGGVGGGNPASRDDGCVPVNSAGAAAYLEAIKVLRPFLSDERRAKMDEVLALRSGNVRFVVEDPINPSNAWACLRTLDSYGIQYVLPPHLACELARLLLAEGCWGGGRSTHYL